MMRRARRFEDYKTELIATMTEELDRADALATAARLVRPLIQWKYDSVNGERLIDNYVDALAAYEKARRNQSGY